MNLISINQIRRASAASPAVSRHLSLAQNLTCIVDNRDKHTLYGDLMNFEYDYVLSIKLDFFTFSVYIGTNLF